MTFVTRNGEDTVRNNFSQSDLHNDVSQQERDSFGYAIDTLPDYNSPNYRDKNVLVENCVKLNQETPAPPSPPT